MSERWRAVPGFHGRYEVSDHGRLRSLVSHRGTPRTTPRILRGGGVQGYPKFNLVDADGRTYSLKLHTLVLLAFRGPPPRRGLECSHLNGDRCDASLSNLVWATTKENGAHRRAYNAKRRMQHGA